METDRILALANFSRNMDLGIFGTLFAVLNVDISSIQEAHQMIELIALYVLTIGSLLVSSCATFACERGIHNSDRKLTIARNLAEAGYGSTMAAVEMGFILCISTTEEKLRKKGFWEPYWTIVLRGLGVIFQGLIIGLIYCTKVLYTEQEGKAEHPPEQHPAQQQHIQDVGHVRAQALPARLSV